MSELRSRSGEHNSALRSPKLSAKFAYGVRVASGSLPKSMELKKKENTFNDSSGLWNQLCSIGAPLVFKTSSTGNRKCSFRNDFTLQNSRL